MEVPKKFRIPCFVEIDIECGELSQRDPDTNSVTMPLRMAGGRIVLEDGTELLTFSDADS